MTPNEIKLMNELRKNCRASNTRISTSIDVPPSTTFKIVKRFENEVIKKHVALIDFAKLGFPIKAGFFLATNKKDELKEFLAEHANINTLLRLSGDHDFYAELMFKDMMCHQEFMDKIIELDIIKKISVHFVTDVKQEEFKIETQNSSN